MGKPKENILTIGNLWHLCIVRWRWFAISVLVCLLFAVKYILTTPYLYTRTASIIISEEALGNNASNSSNSFSDIGFVTQKSKASDVVRHITSLEVLVEVAKEVEEGISDGDAISMAEGIQDRLSAEAEGPNSNIINLTYQDSSTAIAEKTLSLIIKVFNEKWIEDKQAIIRSSSLFIDTRLRLLERDLNLVDDSISSYKSRYGITELENVGNIYLQQQSNADAEILRLMNQKAMAEYIRSLLEDASSQQQLLLVNSGINNNLIESQITLYNNLLLQMQSHMEYTSEQNPLMINLEKELKSLRKNILSNVINHIRTIDIQLYSLREYHGETASKISSNPAQAKHLISIQRSQKVKESLYTFLLQKKEENEISITYKPSPSQVIDMPHGSGKPSSPKRARVLIGAVLFGLIAPLTLIFILASFDSSVRDRSDVEAVDGLLFLGDVPFVKRRISWISRLKRFWKKSDGNPFVVSDGGQDPVNEAFRMIRTHLERYKDSHDDHKVYMATSAEEQTGKTFVGMNLALVLALTGRRVLFIDADLRKHTASRLWRAPKEGLSDYLKGDIPDVSTLFWHQDKYPTLDVLPSGMHPTNPTELLNSSMLGKLIADTRPLYDYIIIDTPHADKLADAEIIAKHADYALYIIRAGVFERNNLEQLKQQEGEKTSRLVVLNQVQIEY
jgi:capsular exopolysaccharide synthesis family protein